MKDNCEGGEFTSSFSFDGHKIFAKEFDIVYGANKYFVSNPKKYQISGLKSSSELRNEVEDKPPPAGCELGKLKEKNLMQRDEHNSCRWTLL